MMTTCLIGEMAPRAACGVWTATAAATSTAPTAKRPILVNDRCGCVLDPPRGRSGRVVGVRRVCARVTDLGLADVGMNHLRAGKRLLRVVERVREVVGV